LFIKILCSRAKDMEFKF